MMRNHLPTLFATGALAVALVGCGDDTAEPGSPGSTLPEVSVPTSDPDPTNPDPTDPDPTNPDPTDPKPSDPDPTDPDGYEHPTGADEVVFAYAELGGFLPRELSFQSTPILLISGDGRVFSPGPQIAIYPAPLLPSIQVSTITEAGIQQLLAAAEEAGLFADIDYTAPQNIADASTATVTIAAEGRRWVHEAYALGIVAPPDGEVTPERQALAQFLADLRGNLIVDPAELGETTAFEPDEYMIQAVAIDDLSAYAGGDVEPTVVEWPADVSVRLADAASCSVVSAAEVGPVLQAANQLTFFDDGGVTYQVLVRPVLPGTECEA